jgi:hypothetical protein
MSPFQPAKPAYYPGNEREESRAPLRIGLLGSGIVGKSKSR